jgi:uncharacterized protein (DUF1501 family)
MHRRQFLQYSGLVSASSLIAIGGHGLAVQGAPTRQSTAQSPHRLVVVFLRGAIDGLSVVVPYQEAAYYKARPQVAIPQPGKPEGVQDLDGQFGLHPALAPLMPLWQEKSLAFVHACGSPDATRSHFDAQLYMESGTPGQKRTSEGWMNRLLQHLPGKPPTQAINLGATTPLILTGKTPVTTLAPSRSATQKSPLDRSQVSGAFDRLYAGTDPLSKAYQDSKVSRQFLQELEAETKAANNGAPVAGQAFTRDAQRLGSLMARDRDVQLAFLSLGGWDTHINQGGSQGQLASRLRALGNGLMTLTKALGPSYENTVILVMSEFGRTIAENGNRGTDHGHGSVMWAFGGPIAGGKVYGQWPGLSTDQLYEGRDLAITTDFRNVVSPVLIQHLQIQSPQLAQIFPGYTPNRPLALIS